jgi:hypothetical protein
MVMLRIAKRLGRDSALPETRVVDSAADFLLQIGDANDVIDRRVAVSRRGVSGYLYIAQVQQHRLAREQRKQPVPQGVRDGRSRRSTGG